MTDDEAKWLHEAKRVYDKQATGIALPDAIYASLKGMGLVDGVQSNATLTSKGLAMVSDIGKIKPQRKKKAKWNGRTYERPV